MVGRNRKPDSTQEILEFLKSQQTTVTSTPPNSNLLSAKNVNALVLAGVIGAFAFLWSNVTAQPKENAAEFRTIASQTAEIRTTVSALKVDFADFRTELATAKKDTAEVRSKVDTNAAEIDAMKKSVQANADRISQLERDTR